MKRRDKVVVQQESLWPNSIRCYDVTLPTMAENLALDEALLADVDANPERACLRFWNPESVCVVLGRSNHVETEVVMDHCILDAVPILRRSTGGGAVLIGPGCLCFLLVMPVLDRHRSLGISNVTTALMSRCATGLSAIHPGVTLRGTSDLAWNQRKVSGNAQRWLRHAFIHHGTILFDFDLPLLERYLRHPTREPDYRGSRGHIDFVMNLDVDPGRIRDCLKDAWNAIPSAIPAAAVHAASRIAETRYGSNDWSIWPSPHQG